MLGKATIASLRGCAVLSGAPQGQSKEEHRALVTVSTQKHVGELQRSLVQSLLVPREACGHLDEQKDVEGEDDDGDGPCEGGGGGVVAPGTHVSGASREVAEGQDGHGEGEGEEDLTEHCGQWRVTEW